MPRGTATYYGTLTAEAWDSEDRHEPGSYKGNLTLEAAFSDSSISGTVNKLRVRPPGGERSDMSPDNRIIISNGQIVNGQFVADWTGKGPSGGGPEVTVSGMLGQLLGEFYGPNAEEVGGVLNGRREATGSDPAQIISGHFYGSEGDGIIEVGDIRVSALAPVYAQDDGAVLADRTGNFGFQSVTRSRDLRGSKDRIKSPVPSADVKSVIQDGSGGYRIVYVVDGREREIQFVGPIDPGSRKAVTVDGNECDLYMWTGRFNGEHARTATAGVNLCAAADDYCEEDFWLNFGHETTPERLTALGSASYSGNFWSLLYPPNGGLSQNWRELTGDLAFDADFAGSSVSGLVDSLRMQRSAKESGNNDPRWEDLAAGSSIRFTDGRIADSRFQANWHGQDADGASGPVLRVRGLEGEVAGAFYGPNGEEVAGVVSGASGQEWMVQGAIFGTKDSGN